MPDQKLICVMLAILAIPFSALAQKQHEAYLDYIEEYKELAIIEMDRSGVPASIKLAQGLLESNAGRSDLAVKAYNHFGIKCGSTWTGGTFKKFDDERNAFGMRVKSCFRRFDSAYDSYVAHSDFLRNASSRYGFLFELDPTDYKGWARGLKKAGYATSSDYHRKLISLIDQYELHQYDRMSASELLAAGGNRPKKNDTFGTTIDSAPSKTSTTVAAREDRNMKTLEFLYNNDVKYVETPVRQSVSQLAKQIKVSPRAILKYNEHLLTSEQLLAPGTRIYVQPKRKNYRGRESMHTVAKGETMMDISIRYGISLSKLYLRNRIDRGSEPVAGAKIKLKGRPVAQRPTTYIPREHPAKETTPAVEIIAANPGEEALDMEIEGNAKFRATRPTTPEAEAQLENDPFSYPKPEVKSNTTTELPKESPAAILGTPKPEIIAGPATDPEVKPAATQPAIFHVVKDGDTLWGISTRYNTTVDKIMEINGLTDSFLLRGMKIRVQ